LDWANGREIAKHFEGLRLKAYLCPGDIWTIGYGSTRGVKPGMEIDLPEAIGRFEADWETAERATRRLCPGLTGNRLEAITDFVFNLGAGRLAASTLRWKLNQSLWDEVPGELRKWVFGGGKRLPGLAARREAEILLFNRN
jgi:lysozyme